MAAGGVTGTGVIGVGVGATLVGGLGGGAVDAVEVLGVRRTGTGSGAAG